MHQEELQELESCIRESEVHIPEGVGRITMPLRYSLWVRDMREHPDPVFSGYIRSGIQQGFRIGFQYHAHYCRSTQRNTVSAGQHPLPAQRYLEKELAVGRIV